MAHKKAGGSSRNGRDSGGQRLGVKLFGGEHPGENVGMGRDHTLFALIEGRITYRTKSKSRVFVSVLPLQEAAAE